MKTIAGKRSPRRHLMAVILALCCLLRLPAAEPTDRQKSTRERYEQVLATNPFQASAFSRVYESYVEHEGVDAWIGTLEQQKTSEARVVLTRIYDRQLDHTKAIEQLESLADYRHPQFAHLAGRIYYRTGDDEMAAKYLGEALDRLSDLDERSNVCRILGHIHLRRGNRTEAIEVWKKIVGEDSNDVFALTELASIYEDNRMWDEAIGIYQRIVKGAADAPYRRCQVLRQIGIVHLQAERHAEAIAAYEKAFDLVAPGNWMFEDLKQRLVTVYQDQGDLKGLLSYLDSRIESQPADLDLRPLRAETYRRLQRDDDAEKELLFILERRPRDAATYEELLALYRETDKQEKVLETYATLIDLFPLDTSYIRRLGELHLQSGQRKLALTTWKMALHPKPTATVWSEIASWCEDHDLNEDAINAYEEALKLREDRDWKLRLADLQFTQGDKDGAKDIWSSLVEPDSSNAERVEIATILDLRQLYDASNRHFREALNADSEDHETRALFARSLMRQKKFNDALEQFDFLFHQNGNEYLRAQGEAGQIAAWRGLGQLAQKQAEWEAALKKQTNSVPLMSRLIRVYERNGGGRRAIDLHERRAKLRPDDSAIQRSLALAYVRQKRNDDAIRTFRNLVDTDRTRARVHLLELLDLYTKSSMREEAIAAAKEIVSLAPADPEAHMQLAKTMRLYEDHDAALQAYRHALRLNATEPKYFQQFAELLVELRRWTEAGNAYERMLEIAVTEESRIAALNGLAKVERENERIDELVARFRARVRATPKKQEAYDDLAIIYQAIDRTDESIRVLEEGLKRVDDERPMLRSLIRFAYDTKDFQSVRIYYEKLLDTKGKPTIEELERLSRIYARTGDTEKAAETLHQIVETAPLNPEVLNRVAGICESLRYLDKGLELRERALEIDPEDRKARYQYVRTLANKGESDRAMKQLYRLLDSADPTAPLASVPRPTRHYQFNNGVLTAYQGLSIAGRLSLHPQTFMGSLQHLFRRPRSSRSSKYIWSGNPDSHDALIRDIAMLSNRSSRHEKTVTEWTEKIEKEPKNLHLRRGLIVIFESASDTSGAAKAATDYAELDPDNYANSLKAALYHTDNGNYDDAIALLTRIGATTNAYSSLADQSRVSVLLRAGRSEDAEALARTVIARDTNNVSSYQSIAQLMHTRGRNKYARELYEELFKRDGATRLNADMSLAAISAAEDNKYEAAERYKRLLTGYLNESGIIAFAMGNSPGLYVPGSMPARRVFSPFTANMPTHIARVSHYHRVQAFNELGKQLGDLDKTFVPGEMNKTVLGYAKARDQNERNSIWEIAKILCGHHLKQKRHDEILKLMAFLGEAGRKDVEWFNIRLLALHMKLDFAGMKEVYNEYAELNPGKATEIARARSGLKRAEARKTPPLVFSTRSLSSLGSVRSATPSASRVSISARLDSIEKLYRRRKDLGMRLLKSELARNGRTFENLLLFGEFHMGLGNTNEAKNVATELWSKRSRKDESEFEPKSFFTKGSSSRTTVMADPELIAITERFRNTGQLPQLYRLVEEQAKNKPTKENLRELAHVYHFTHQPDKAISAYEELLRKHKDPASEKNLKRLKAAHNP